VKNNIRSFLNNGLKCSFKSHIFRINYYRELSDVDDIKKIGKDLDPSLMSYLNDEQKDALNKLKEYTKK